MNKTRKRAILAALIGNSIFGFSFLFSKIILDMTTPEVLVAVRFLVAFLALNILIFVGKRLKKQDGSPMVEFSLKGKPKKNLILLAVFQPLIYFLAEGYGIQYTSSAFAGTIISIIPLIGILLDVIIMRIKVTKIQVLCAVGTVVRVAITTLGAGSMYFSAFGLLMLLLAVFASAFFFVFSKKSSEHYNAIERTYAMFAIGAAVFTVIAAIQCRGAYTELVYEVFCKPAFWGAILYLSVFSSVIAFVSLNWANTYINVSEASIFANFTTVISIVAGVVILKENFTIPQMLGAVIILVSVYISNKCNTTE